MSDQWGTTPGEQDASGSGGYTGGKINISVPGMEDVASGVKALTQSLQELKTTMASFGQNQHQLGQGVANTIQSVQTASLGATDSIKTMFQSLTGARPGAGSMATILDYGLASGIPQDLAMFPLRYLQSTIGQNRQFALNVGGAMAGQQYASGLSTQGMFSNLANTLGAGIRGLPTGTGEEISQFMNIARQAGAMVDYTRGQTGITATNPRTSGFLTSAWEMQQMNPAMPLGQIGASIGGFAANTAAQRQGAYLTGGAFSMVKAGGQLKSISEWSESILRWLEGQRPGNMRGQGFTYGELLTQQYPGSNIDAWFDANGVPPDMQEQWWNYALAKARTKDTTTGPMMMVDTAMPTGIPNPALQRLRTTQPLTQTSFTLAGRNAGFYAQREDANQEFNRMLGGAMTSIIPKALGGPLGFTKNLPDPVEELIMSLLERIPLLGPALGGAIGWAGLGAAGGGGLIETLMSEVGPVFGGLLDQIPNLDLMMQSAQTIMMNEMTGGLSGALGGAMPGTGNTFSSMFNQLTGNTTPSGFGWQTGDVGDLGDWSPMGALNPNSLHPSMSRKVSAMMKANPRIKVNSGRRDEVLQRKLKAGGHSRVSGKSSAHTRGLAADLGPRSEYGWIIANAHKFGLKSGAGHGEPWHVGMPGIGDIDIGEASDATVDTTTPAVPPVTTPPASTSTVGGTTRPKPKVTKFEGPAGLGGLLGLFGGGEADVAGSMGGLLNFLFGSFGGAPTSEADIDKALAYDPDFARKAFAAGVYKTGGKYGGGTLLDQVRDAIIAKTKAGYGTNTAAATTPANGTGSQTLVGALQALGLASTGLSDGAMVALLANKAGFTGQDLVTAVAIAGRESKYNPKAHNPNRSTGDDSYGLFQINMIDSLGPSRRAAFGITKNEDLWDPLINLKAAHQMAYSRDTPFYDWGPYKGKPATYDTDVNAAQGYVSEAGLGDVDNSMPMPQTMVAGTNSTTVQFHNTFVVQGGNGNGGIDTRRIVTMVADQLESEMRRRMARTN